MKKFQRVISFFSALFLAASLPCGALADDEMDIEIIPETGAADIEICIDKDNKKISPYIYGINDTGDLSGLYPTVIKQVGTELTAYNWETNFSNSGKKGQFVNDISLVDNYAPFKWSTPALYVEKLVSRSRSGNIPVRLLTLPMLGYAAKDSMGIVQDDESSIETRWCRVINRKDDTYLNQPDTSDNAVYVDEYLSYLINRFGTASEGGINGYFLDSEPDKWAENFSVLHPEPLTFASLVDRSARLAETVKTMDSKAFVFGPSLSGLQGCINLNDPSSRLNDDNDYSWFIDYYLSGMRSESEKAGQRLLDVLDVHYYTEALTPTGTEVRTQSDVISNAYRMQSVRTLWDADYAENAVTVMHYKQFTPVIPALEASIKMYYPNTRLSFSEYDFGGGDNMSGAVAETDVLGIFASNDVYLACLSPSSEDFRFQKAALRLYTNYDGKGGKFGNTLVYSDNGGDVMSSVYAAVNDFSPDELTVILTNKQLANKKDFDIKITSDEYSYSLEKVFCIDSDTARIKAADTDDFDCTDNRISFTADTESVYLLVLSGTKAEETEETDVIWTTADTETEEDTLPEDTEEAVSEITETEATLPPETEYTEDDPSVPTEDIADATVPDLTAPDPTETSVTTVTEATTISVTTEETISETAETVPVTEDGSSPVPTLLKVVVSAMCLTVFAGVIYILFFDKK